MADGTGERSLKRRRIDETAPALREGTDGALVGAIGWVVVHDAQEHQVVFPLGLQLAESDKILISRALVPLIQYPYEIQFLTRPTPGSMRSVSDKIKYNIQACPPLPPGRNIVGGPCWQVEVQFPVGVVLPMILFSNISATDPARIPPAEIKGATRADKGPDNTLEMTFIVLFRVYANPQNQERITYIHHGYTSPHAHPPGAIPVSEASQAKSGWFTSFLG